MKKTLRFTDGDNVVVALEAVSAGDELVINGEPSGIKALSDVPQGHKLAVQDMKTGDAVVKYGHTVGYATVDIPRGCYVHVHNVRDTISDWRGSVRPEYDPSAVTEISDSFILGKQPGLTGYRRKDGSVGWRNYVLVVSTCACGNQPVDDVKCRIKEKDVVCVTNPSGCVILPNDRDEQNAMLLGLARNPNVGAVIFVGLGCEAVTADKLYEAVKDEKPAACVISHQYISCADAADAIESRALELLAQIRKEKRTPATVADIRLGVQCGASDWTTAAAANPAIGWCSDAVVKNGGISILGETCGWFGGEAMMIKQSRTREVAERVTALMGKVYDRCLFYGRRIEEANPAPGNIAGGITTLCEKALGNTLKGGTAPIEGVLSIGEQPPGPGYYVSENPGLDAASVFTQTMNSCNVIVYSTGRGSPVGTPIAPVVKLTASPQAAEHFSAHMDVILTDIVLEGKPISDGGRRLFDKMIEVCGGEESIAETQGHREYAFPLMMGPM